MEKALENKKISINLTNRMSPKQNEFLCELQKDNNTVKIRVGHLDSAFRFAHGN